MEEVRPCVAQERLAAEIIWIYRETMATTPGNVEVCLGRQVLTAFLRECACQAERNLWPKEEGARLLEEYHAACARELFAPFDELARRLLGRALGHVWLRAVPGTNHKLLVLILAEDQEGSP